MVNLKVDQLFFDKWTPESTYVLGLLMADGTITLNSRGSKYIEFVSTDKELVDNVRSLLRSEHKISEKRLLNRKWKRAYRIQIGNKRLVNRLEEVGFGI